MLTESSLNFRGMNSVGVRRTTGGFAQKSKAPAFGGFYNNKITRGTVNSVTKMVNESGAIFADAFSLGVTVFIRPFAILFTPSAEKRDKQYAAAHSIGSGLVGFGTAWLMFKPIAKANERFLKNIEPIARKNDLLENFEKILEKKGDSQQTTREFQKKIAETKNPLIKKIFKNVNKPEEMVKKLQETIKTDTQKIPEKLRYLTKSKPLEMYKRLTTHGLRLVTIPAVAFLTISLLSPIMKKLFPKKSKETPPHRYYAAARKLSENSPLNNELFSTFMTRTQRC